MASVPAYVQIGDTKYYSRLNFLGAKWRDKSLLAKLDSLSLPKRKKFVWRNFDGLAREAAEKNLTFGDLYLLGNGAPLVKGEGGIENIFETYIDPREQINDPYEARLCLEHALDLNAQVLRHNRVETPYLGLEKKPGPLERPFGKFGKIAMYILAGLCLVGIVGLTGCVDNKKEEKEKKLPPGTIILTQPKGWWKEMGFEVNCTWEDDENGSAPIYYWSSKKWKAGDEIIIAYKIEEIDPSSSNWYSNESAWCIMGLRDGLNWVEVTINGKCPIHNPDSVKGKLACVKITVISLDEIEFDYCLGNIYGPQIPDMTNRAQKNKFIGIY